MKVTYLDHCGYMVTTDKAIIVFDYFRDPSHALHKALEDHPYFPVVFFMSHYPKDRPYHPDIYEIAQNHKRTYVMSNGILPQGIPSDLAVAGMSAGDILEDLPGIKEVKAYKSTDKGSVTFVVTLDDGHKIFHGGNIGEYKWHGGEAPSERDIAKAEEEFKVIINHIASEVPEVYIGMFPLYTGQASDFTKYAKEYLQTIKTDNYFPMNIGDTYSEACDFDSYVLTPGTKCHCLHNPGVSVKLD
ncbi:MAG: hypothetical protein NC117_10750 [Pseudoflavonifractor sp.]|nr:hypothetical protein [Pseudoflavonifractor sp.]